MSENEKKYDKILDEPKKPAPVEELDIPTQDTVIERVGDESNKPSLNKFDTFFIRIWAYICSAIYKLSEWIQKGIEFVIKKRIPRKYISATLVTVIIILFILIIAVPASSNGTAKEVLDLYPNNLVAVQRRVGTDAEGDPIYKWGYANKSGAIKIACEYDGALEFKYGVAFVKVIQTQNNYVYWKLINKQGKNVGDRQFVETDGNIPVEQFSDSQKLAKVLVNSRYGYINTKGNLVISAIYRDAGPFIGKLARVSAGSSSYFINTKGKRVSAEFDGARDMVDGYAAINIAGRWGFVNSKGSVVIEAIYDEVSDFYCGYAAVKQGTSYGVIDEKGKQVVTTGMFSSLNILEYFDMK